MALFGFLNIGLLEKKVLVKKVAATLYWYV